MQRGIDCATKLTEQSARALKSAGYDYAIRYLGSSDWKRLFEEEVDAIQKVGLKLVSVWEADANRESYFTYDKGKEDALFANQYAKQVGQPSGSAIYFAVDYDCHNISVVKDYFRGVKANLDKSFKVGVYGSYGVVMGLKNDVDFFFQTYAWSHGKVADHVHICQYKNGQVVEDIQVDLDKVFKSPGHWVEPVQLDYVKPKQITKTYKIKSGDTFWELEEKHGWKHGTIQTLNHRLDPKKLSIGQKIQVPVGKQKFHVIEKGDTFWELEEKNHWSHGSLQDLNPHIDTRSLQIGQKIKIPN